MAFLKRQQIRFGTIFECFSEFVNQLRDIFQSACSLNWYIDWYIHYSVIKVGNFSSRVMLILCKFLHGESSSYLQWVYTHTWADILTALFRLWKLFSCVSHTTVQVVLTTVIPVVYDVWIMMFAISINNSTMYVYWIIHSMNIWK